MLHVIRYLHEKVTKPIIIIFSLISNKYTINIFINKAFLGIKMKFILISSPHSALTYGDY